MNSSGIGAFDSARSLSRPMAVLGVIGAGLSILGLLVDRTNFFAAYLEAYIFVLAFPMGALGLLMIHHLTQGAWGWTLRPFLLAGIRTLPWMVVFFIPVVFGMHTLYPWTHPDVVAANPALQAKACYLNSGAFLARSAFYFATWLVLAHFMNRWAMKGPKVYDDLKSLHRVQKLSAGGLILYMLTMSFAAIDWLMSLQPEWFSSLFGAIIVVGQGMTAFAIGTYVAILLHRRNPNPWVTQRNLHDLGKFLFMTVLLWGYTNLSQYLIIWMGNLPEENFWYQMRYDGWWKVITFIFVMGQFTLPFFILLPASVKKNADALLKVIPFLLLIRLMEQVYLVAPPFREGKFPLHWLDLAVPMGMGGLYAALYFTSLGNGKSLVPQPVLMPPGHHPDPEDKGPQDRGVLRTH